MDDDRGVGGHNDTLNVGLVSLATSNRSNTVTFQENKMLLWSLTMIRRPNSSSTQPDGPFTAAECGLFYCVKNYTSQVNDGVIIESSIPLPQNITPDSRQPIDQSIPDPSPETLDTRVTYPRTDLQLSEKYNISQIAINAIASGMREVFVDSNINDSLIGANGFMVTSSSGAEVQFSPQSMQPIHQSSDLNSTFNILATSLTNNMRSNDDNSALVTGSMGIVVYRIRWPWICLPFINVIGTGIFLAIVIRHTRTHNLWKSSSLAVLKCGDQIQGLLADETYVTEMEKKAEKAYVIFSESENGKFKLWCTLRIKH
jgi:hypothetical protein